jgi:hypothetical protein
MSRRECLRVGGIGMLGLSLSDLLQSPGKASLTDGQFGRAKNVIFLWLQGGPPQHETFDPKPGAPIEVRGEFKPISTNVPGIHISELLPRTAAIADKYAIVRSLVTGSNIHSASGYYVLTGYPYQGPNARQISRTDWPYFGSIVNMLKPSTKFRAYSAVWLPDVMRLNDNVMPAGQTAGFLGMKWEPEKVIWDSSDPKSQIEKFKLLPDVPLPRLNARKSLLDQIDRHFQTVNRSRAADAYDQQTQEAFSVLTTGRALSAFDIEREPAKVRSRYGNSKWGQCVLLARRLIEAGVRLVHVNWVREEGDNAVGNPMWDTHSKNADRLQDVLCPQFDIGFTALIDDLDDRGLLDETLVVAVGEFGRTPKINARAGRDHWGNVSNFVMAGAGIQTAQVIGASDRIGGEPVSGRVEPKDLTATIFHLLGIRHDMLFFDRAEIPHQVTQGSPILALLGSGPATDTRREPEGDISLVPSYTTEKLRNTAFQDDVPLHRVDGSRRIQGWQATPLAAFDRANGLAVRLVDKQSQSIGGNRHVVLGFGLNDPSAPVEIPQGSQAILTQEIRNPRSGRFTLSVAACGGGSPPEFFKQAFLDNFTCRLAIFRYSDVTKDMQKSQLLGQSVFRPAFAAADMPQYKTFDLSEFLGTRAGNANFLIGIGIGIAVIVEKSSPGVLRWPAAESPHSAFVRVDEVFLDFVGKQRLPNQK